MRAFAKRKIWIYVHFSVNLIFYLKYFKGWYNITKNKTKKNPCQGATTLAGAEQLCFCCHKQMWESSQQQITHVTYQSVTFHEFEQRLLILLLSQHCFTLSNYALLTAFRSKSYVTGQYETVVKRVYFCPN